MSEAVLLASVQTLVDIVRRKNRQHPGLTLDKHLPAGKQDTQKAALDKVCQASGDSNLLTSLATRRSNTWPAGTVDFTATTASPLTLHLSRATALENAGIALHPLYGFAYLPGSGLKGAARAYAETIWLPAQSDQVAASQAIIDVFGCVSGSEREKDSLPASRQEADASQAGVVVFHDAWPKDWPKLFVDIAAIHHTKYYQGAPPAPPPGDWEEPTLVSFLAIPAGVEFRFALAPRMSGPRVDPEKLRLAKTWLTGALDTLGIGAKTSAGYGLFRTDAAPISPLPARAEAKFDLTLVTPAFLAGAAQAKDDCDLRGATLRGQLRWWWRAMHAGHLETATLRRLEAAIWGASSEGSAVQLQLTASIPGLPKSENPKTDRSFLSKNGITAVPARGRIQGLSYVSYGMAEKSRFFRQPGDAWSVRLIARPSRFRDDPKAKRDIGVQIDAAKVLAEATAALWLLTRYGGVGSKGRKGFGSFADVIAPAPTDLNAIRQQAARLRQHCGLVQRLDNAPCVATLEGLKVEEIPLRWENAWYAIDSVGRCYQDAVKDSENNSAKELLGMPRKKVRSKYARLASALHLHLSLTAGSGLVARVTTFDLSGINPNAAPFLARLRGVIKDRLTVAAKDQRAGHAELYPPVTGRPAAATATQPAPSRDGLHVGQRGHDVESGQEVEIKAIEGKQLRVLFIGDDEEDVIPAANFRPPRRR